MEQARTIEFSNKQLEYLINANCRWNGKIGATQCGKTHIDVVQVIPENIISRLGQAGLVIIAGVSKTTIERNILEPMRERWGSKLVGEINNENEVFLFGETCYVLGTEKKSQVGKLRGARIKYLYWDEICEANEEVFELAKSRLSFEYSRCDFTANPREPTHFIKKFIDRKDIDLYVQTWTIFDNPFLPASFVQDLCKQYAGSVYYDRYILGMWKRAEGAIYTIFCDNIKDFIIDEIPRDLDYASIRIGVDFGGTKSAHAFVAVGYTRGGREVIVLDERLIEDATIPASKLKKLYSEFAKDVYNKIRNAFMTYYDNAESVLGKSIEEAVNENHIPTIVKKAKKIEINDRIKLTIALMGSRRLKIMRSCKHLIQSFQEAVWDDKATNDVRLDNNTYCVDILDAFEYCIERDMNVLIRLS